MESLKDLIFAGPGWMVVSIVLFGLEFLAPGIYFMWVGFAALLVSGVVFIFPELSWQVQSLMFSALAVGSVLIGRKYLMEKEKPSDDSTLNRRGQQYVGRTCEVVEAFKNGKGRVKIEDTIWSAVGPNTVPKGASVKVVSVDGTRLRVELA